MIEVEKTPSLGFIRQFIMYAKEANWENVDLIEMQNFVDWCFEQRGEPVPEWARKF